MSKTARQLRDEAWSRIPTTFIQAAHTAAVEAGYSGDPADQVNHAFMEGYLTGDRAGFHRAQAEAAEAAEGSASTNSAHPPQP